MPFPFPWMFAVPPPTEALPPDYRPPVYDGPPPDGQVPSGGGWRPGYTPPRPKPFVPPWQRPRPIKPGDVIPEEGGFPAPTPLPPRPPLKPGQQGPRPPFRPNPIVNPPNYPYRPKGFPIDELPRPSKPPRGIPTEVWQGIIGAIGSGVVAGACGIDGRNCYNLFTDITNGHDVLNQLYHLETDYENLQAQLVNILKNCTGRQRAGGFSVIPNPEDCIIDLREFIRQMQGAINQVRQLISDAIQAFNLLSHVDCDAVGACDPQAIATYYGAAQAYSTVVNGYQDALNTYNLWLAAVAAIKRKCSCSKADNQNGQGALPPVGVVGGNET